MHDHEDINAFRSQGGPVVVRLGERMGVPSFWGWVITWMAFAGIPCLGIGKVFVIPVYEYGGIALIAPAVLAATILVALERWPNMWRPPPLDRRIYMRVSRNEIYARSVNTGLEFRDEPLLGTMIEKGFEMAWAVGSLVRTSRDDFQTAVGADVPLTVVNPFEHENLYVHDAKHATAILAFAQRQVDPRWSAYPTGIVLHVVEDTRGPLTELERHVFFVVASGLGGGNAIHVGADLNDQEVSQCTLTRGTKSKE